MLYNKISYYFKNLALFPDRDLGFSTTLNLQKVLGFNIGNYDVTVSYADYTSSLNFDVNTEENSSVSNSVESSILKKIQSK